MAAAPPLFGPSHRKEKEESVGAHTHNQKHKTHKDSTNELDDAGCAAPHLS